MRRFVLLSSAAAAVFFAALLAYTFFAREHLRGLALEYVTAKTERFAEPAVRLAEQTIESKAVQTLLGDERLARVHGDIADYRRNPHSYIAALTGKRLTASDGETMNPMAEKALGWKQRAVAYFGETLQALITDLRIFAGSNLAASLAALAMAFSAGEARLKRLAWFSLAILVAVAYCSYMYVDSMSFFRILARTHMGWWYPVTLAAVAVALYFDLRRNCGATDTQPQARA